ncbi:DUF296 domain-containing protein [Cyanobium sp. FGCU-6]|nr:DUF296 domain-containing protein [Cyanobium sp. FGCU6]
MRPQALKLGPGSDLRLSLEQLAIERNASGFVLGVVGNLARAAFQCPGQAGPTVLEGDLEIITLQGTVSPQGVHLHLSLSDGACQVWGGHLEPGTLVLKGADLLVGFLASADSSPPVAAPLERPTTPSAEPRVEIAVATGCPWSARALRLLRTLGIAHQVLLVEDAAGRQELERLSGHGGVPQVFIDGQWIGGYDALAELHGQGALEILRG